MACRIWQLAAQTHYQMMGYVIKTPEDHLLVIDGGWQGDMPFLWHLLQKYGGEKPHIDAWFMTHPHSDHVLALCEMAEKKHGQFSIGTLYHHFPSRDLIARGEPGALRAYDAFENVKAGFHEEILSEGQRLQFGSVDFEVLYVSDPDIVKNTSNNSSCVLRMTAEGKSVLFLGDLGKEGGDKLLSMHGDKLQSDVVQMAHHGQSAVKMNVYDAIHPEICLWSAPNWLHNNNQGCRGYDSGVWDILHVRRHMKAQGVRRHAFAKDGTMLLTINAGCITLSTEDPYFVD